MSSSTNDRMRSRIWCSKIETLRFLSSQSIKGPLSERLYGNSPEGRRILERLRLFTGVELNCFWRHYDFDVETDRTATSMCAYPCKFPDGSTRWYRNGLLHRDDGPAWIRPDGTCEWYRDGHRHREDGPAIQRSDGSREYWLNGEIVSTLLLKLV